jgi:2-oxo-3-hexenedioate decarboxylase
MGESDDADLLLDCHDRARQLPRVRPEPLTDPDRAQRIQDRIVAARRARGERTRGYKIGFTNRTIWPLYNVHQPIFGPIWDTSLSLLEGTAIDLPLARFVQPRLEPEIVLGLARTPASDRPEDLIAATAWIAHGFEVVQSVYPDWVFTAAETQAAQALHAALRVGPQVPVSAFEDPLAQLAGLTIELMCDGRHVATGQGRDVLDGPVQALGFLVRQLQALGRRLNGGDVVTTGTLTDAQPLVPGQMWTTRLAGVPLPGLALRTHA